jgi:mannose-6-phosphate isomerase
MRKPPSKPSPVPLYPLRFQEIVKDKVWGGDAFKRLLGKKCGPKAGESWEIADIGKESSVVANGPLKGKKLRDLLKTDARTILGEDIHIRHERFPLILKFLHAKDRLSLQVHPTDEFARAYEPEGTGKMEAWYIISATPESRIIRGVLPGTSETEFRESLSNGKIEDCINKLRVKDGEVIFIPPGTVHSAYGDLLLFEVQQASDFTYRFTDWGRSDLNGRPRELQVERAIKAMDLQSIGVSKLKPTRLAGFAYKRHLLIKCEKFTLEKIDLSAGKRGKEPADPTRFKTFTVLAGRGKFLYGAASKKEKPRAEPFAKGQTFLLPAHLGEYTIHADSTTEMIVCYP